MAQSTVIHCSPSGSHQHANLTYKSDNMLANIARQLCIACPFLRRSHLISLLEDRQYVHLFHSFSYGNSGRTSLLIREVISCCYVALHCICSTSCVESCSIKGLLLQEQSNMRGQSSLSGCPQLCWGASTAARNRVQVITGPCNGGELCHACNATGKGRGCQVSMQCCMLRMFAHIRIRAHERHFSLVGC